MNQSNVRVRLRGTRGSLASPGSDTARYGGNTSCVQVEDADGTLLILDAGSGIRGLGQELASKVKRVNILLTHLHLDHILGLGFFGPLFDPRVEAHIWGPASATQTLMQRLMRYLSPPLFPLHLSELSETLTLHEIPSGDFDIGEFHISASLVCHPGPTVGYRVAHSSGAVICYLPDHEPALGVDNFPLEPEWTSGYDLATRADLLIHDSQYTPQEYVDKIGWGHSTMEQAMIFAQVCDVREFVSFHYDPAHSDADIDRMVGAAQEAVNPRYRVTPGVEGMEFEL